MSRLLLMVKRLVRLSPIPLEVIEKWLFRVKLGYWPNFENPQSFSEKLHYRKFHERDQRLVTLSDKCLVRDFVQERVGAEYLVPALFIGKSIDSQTLHDLGDNLIVKRNNDSGSIYPVVANSAKIAESICAKLSANRDYGTTTNEWWYREIEPAILVEKLLVDPNEFCPIDYKFFVFENYMFVEVIRRRSDGVVECGIFDEQMNPMTFDGKAVARKGCAPFEGEFPAKDTFEEMSLLALKLSEGFNFIRVDLYSVNGRVYFGELTFCPSEGRVDLAPVQFDQHLGDKWQGDVLLSGAVQSRDFELSICNH